MAADPADIIACMQLDPCSTNETLAEALLCLPVNLWKQKIGFRTWQETLLAWLSAGCNVSVFLSSPWSIRRLKISLQTLERLSVRPGRDLWPTSSDLCRSEWFALFEPIDLSDTLRHL